MLCYVFWSQVEYGIVCFISLAQIRIFIDPVSQIIFFLVDILTMAYFFINCAEKANFFKDSSRMGP